MSLEKLRNIINTPAESNSFVRGIDHGALSDIDSFEIWFDLEPYMYVQDIPVYWSDQIMQEASSVIECSFHLEDGEYVIIIDSLFAYDDYLSDSDKEVILYHEVGHMDDPETNGLKRELNADKYSALIVGRKNSIRALQKMKYIISYLFQDLHDDFVHDVHENADMRISALKNW